MALMRLIDITGSATMLVLLSPLLRVEWSLGNGPYLPRDKSVPEDSLIYAAWRDKNFTLGEEWLDLDKVRGKFCCENQPFEVEGE